MNEEELIEELKSFLNKPNYDAVDNSGDIHCSKCTGYPDKGHFPECPILEELRDKVNYIKTFMSQNLIDASRLKTLEWEQKFPLSIKEDINTSAIGPSISIGSTS